MQFVFVKKPAVQIKPTSTGKLTKSQILILALIYRKNQNKKENKTNLF